MRIPLPAIVLSLLVVFSSPEVRAQIAPAVPQQNVLVQLQQTSSAPPAQQAAPPQAQQPASARNPSSQTLTLQEAEKIAIQNHPQIQAAINLATVAQEQVKQTRSAYYPLAVGNLTGVGAQNNSRITAGALNSPHVFGKYGNGFQVNQLITDFGRTHELVNSSNLHAQAEQERVTTSREDVLIAVDRAYFGVLKNQTLLRVAEATVKERRLVTDQISVEAKNQLKSGLDVSFAQVNLQQAQLLLIQAQNNLQASFADLSNALGYSDQRTFQLAEEPMPSAPPANWSQLIQQALRDRPELISQRFDVSSAQSYATAERDLWFPTLSAAGVAGLTPVRADGLDSTRYAAAGFNLEIPLFNGHLFGALRNEANAEARAQQQYLRDLQDNITRDVRTAWLAANSGYQRLSVTQQLLLEAQKALDLATARYRLGLSSIVELSQAQLNETQAEIDEASAKYDYQTEIAVLNYEIGTVH
jgi:outer membrane protein